MTKPDRTLQLDAPPSPHHDRAAEAAPPAPASAVGAAMDQLAQFQMRFPVLEDQIDSLLVRGTSLQAIQRQMAALYGVTIPADVIAAYARSALLDAGDWLHRALDVIYPIVVFDTLRIKLRSANAAQNRPCLLAVGMKPSGAKEMLGLWIDDGREGLWRAAAEDLKLRGVQDVLIFVGPDPQAQQALTAEFPESDCLFCIVELIRRSLEFATSQRRAALSTALKHIYCALDMAEAFRRLEAFAASELGRQYPVIHTLWARDWPKLTSLFDISLDIRRIVASTFAIDGLQRDLRRVGRVRADFSSAAEAEAHLALVCRSSQRQWKRPHRDWHRARTQLALRYPARFGS